LAVLYLSKGEHKNALGFIKKALTFLDSNSYSRQLIDCYSILNSIYHEQKDYLNELRFFKLHAAANDSANSREKVSNITKMEMQFEFDKIHLADSIKSVEEIKLRDAKISEKRYQSFFLFSVLLLTIVALGLIYSRFQYTKKQKQIIEEKNREITDSINYAKKIQSSIMPNDKYFEKELERLKNKNGKNLT